MSSWTWAAFFAATLIAVGALYVRLRWRRSPQAYRAMVALAACYFIAGLLIGAWVVHLVVPGPVPSPVASTGPSAAVGVPISRAVVGAPSIAPGGSAPPPAGPVSIPTLVYDPARAARPDPRMTPGDVISDATKDDVCTPGWASEHRHVTESERDRVYAEYGRARGPGCCEVDHLVPLELGGSNDIKNLWPQPDNPRPGDAEKDQLENTLHRLVCKGDMPLAEAQRCIASDWVKCWEEHVVPEYGAEWAAANRHGW